MIKNTLAAVLFIGDQHHLGVVGIIDSLNIQWHKANIMLNIYYFK